MDIPAKLVGSTIGAAYPKNKRKSIPKLYRTRIIGLVLQVFDSLSLGDLPQVSGYQNGFRDVIYLIAFFPIYPDIL